MNHLTSEQLQHLRQQLQEEKTNLNQRLEKNESFGLQHSHREGFGELSMIDNHPADIATEQFERGKDLALREHAEIQLEQIDQALEHMEKGNYGICLICHQPISYDRLEALPATAYCQAHSPAQFVSERRPIEESLLNETSVNEHGYQPGFDGEDAWQSVEMWGNSNTPAMAEDPEFSDDDQMVIEADEHVGFVEPIESFLATNLDGSGAYIIRNQHYRNYLEQNEGDRRLEIDPR